MRCLLLLAFVAVSYAALPAHVQAVVGQMQTLQSRVHQAAHGFVVQDDTFNGICNGTFFGNLLGGLGEGITVDISGIQGCFSGVCGLVLGGSCPGLQDFFTATGEGCPAVPGSVVATNCANGCFGRFVAPLVGLGPCLVNAMLSLFQGLANQFCGPLPEPQRTACFDSLQNPPEEIGNIGNALPTTEIANAISRLCLQNPSNGAYCYAVLAGGAAQFPGGNPATINDDTCAFWASLGCCATGLSALLPEFNATSCGSSGSPFTGTQLQAALAGCSATGAGTSGSNPSLANVPACPLAGQSVKFVKNSFVLTGILIGGYNALSSTGKLLFFKALTVDIGTAVGLTSSQLVFINVGKLTAGTGTNVVVEFSIRAGSDTATDALGAQVKVFLAGSTAPVFTATVAFGVANSGVVSGSGVGLDRATSTSTTETQTGASGVASLSASMMVLVLAMLIAIAFRF